MGEVVHHKHALLAQKAGLAQPYDVHSKPWNVTDTGIRGDAQIDPGKKLD